MKRNGFTMVELIFVIIIIGILSVAAIPKFGDIKDRAKVATEYAALSSLDVAITGLVEFQYEDYQNIYIDWHKSDVAADVAAAAYATANTDKSVLKRLVKKGDNLKIIAFTEAGTVSTAGKYDDIIFIKGAASNETLGTEEKDDAVNGGNGKPDKNDVWVFNGSKFIATINYHDGSGAKSKTLQSGDLVLIDNGKEIADYTAGADAAGTAATSTADGVSNAIAGEIEVFSKTITTEASAGVAEVSASTSVIALVTH